MKLRRILTNCQKCTRLWVIISPPIRTVLLTKAILKGVGNSMAFPQWLVPIVIQLLKLVSPSIAGMLREFAVDFYFRARETLNPFDDVLAGALLGLVGIETPDPIPVNEIK